MDIQSLCLRISRTENLPVLPTVVIQILRLYEDPNVSPRSLEKVIEQDAALTAKILRVASSSMYGSSSTGSVGRALSVLGMNTLRSISISLAYQQILANTKGVQSAFDKNTFWRHCLATGVGCKAIARILAPTLIEELYVGGLIHDIGMLALDRFLPQDFNRIIKVAKQSKRTLSSVENDILGFCHAEVGGILAEKWKLSPLMSDAIRYHHSPEDDPKNPLFTAIVVAANHLAHHNGFGAVDQIPGDAEGDRRLRELGLTDEQIEEISATIIAEVDQADKTYSGKAAA